MEPPRSDPMPNAEPANACRQPSPPDDPPAVQLVLKGLLVRPCRRFELSHLQK